MNPDLTWHLQVLDKTRGHYIALVERKVLSPGLCWLLKPSKSLSKKHPNIESLHELAKMTNEECNLFWKTFFRKYGDKMQEHFGAKLGHSEEPDYFQNKADGLDAQITCQRQARTAFNGIPFQY
jgi:hypothetical protein